MQAKTDTIFCQWNDVLNGHLAQIPATNSTQNHQDYLLKWLEMRISTTVSTPVNSSDKIDLQLRMAYTQVVSREVAKVSEILKESKSQHNKISLRNSSSADLQGKVSHLSNSLMKLKDELAQKMKQLDRLKLLLSEAIECVDEFLKILEFINKSNKSQVEERITLLRLKVDKKSILLSELQNLYFKIQTDVEQNQFTMKEEINSQMESFEDKWSMFKLKCKNIGVYLQSTPINNQVHKPSRLVSDISNEEKIDGCSPVSQVSSVSCDTEAVIASRTTYSNSQSSFLSEEAAPSTNIDDTEQINMINTLIHDIKHCLEGILWHISNNAANASQYDSVKELLRRYQGNLQEIDAKKIRLDNLMDQLPLKKDVDLQNNFQSCLLQYNISKEQILSRVSDLIQLSSDVEQLKRKHGETLQMLKAAEEQLSPEQVALANDCTCDLVNSYDIKEANVKPGCPSSDITKNKHRVKLFAEFSRKIILTYEKDDTSDVQLAMDDILRRNDALIKRFTSNTEAMSSKTNETSNNFCAKLSMFLDWLLTIETSIRRLDEENSSGSKDVIKFNEQLKDIKHMIASKDAEFSALKLHEQTNNSEIQIKIHKVKLDELTPRWKNLQNKILGLSIHDDYEEHKITRCIEEETINTSVTALFSEHEVWIRERKKELSVMVVAGDVCGITKQIDNQKRFKAEINDRHVEIQKTFDRNLKEQTGNINSENKKLEKLLGSLRSLTKSADQWGIKLDDNHMKISIFETSMTNLDYKLNQINSISNKTDEAIKLFTLKQDLISLEDDLSNLINQEQELKNSLSPQNIVMLESLKDRVRNLANSQHEPETYCLPNGWERGIQDEIPYFINHLEESTQWDHPVFTELMISLVDLNWVKFSAYRMALKLRRVQKKLSLEQLDLESAMFGFEMHGLTSER